MVARNEKLMRRKEEKMNQIPAPSAATAHERASLI